MVINTKRNLVQKFFPLLMKTKMKHLGKMHISTCLMKGFIRVQPRVNRFLVQKISLTLVMGCVVFLEQWREFLYRRRRKCSIMVSL